MKNQHDSLCLDVRPSCLCNTCKRDNTKPTCDNRKFPGVCFSDCMGLESLCPVSKCDQYEQEDTADEG